jgi:hypothetical protein
MVGNLFCQYKKKLQDTIMKKKKSQPNIEKKEEDMIIRLKNKAPTYRKVMPPITKVIKDKKKDNNKKWCRQDEGE